jgi:hypothetical protein
MAHMNTRMIFAGPAGHYEVAIPESQTSLEDHPIVVSANGATSRWHVHVDDTDASGARRLAGMTGDGSGLWFELALGDPATLSYWGDRVLVRVDALV